MNGPGEMDAKPQSPVAGVKDADNADEIHIFALLDP